MALNNHKRSKQLLVLLSDAVLVAASVLLSYALRFNTLDLAGHWHAIVATMTAVLPLRLALFSWMGLYRGLWRFVGVRDLVAVIKAVTVSSALSVGLLFLLYRLEGFPRSVLLIDWFVCLVLVGGSRFAYRLYREGWSPLRNNGASSGKRMLIVGAGRAGELILREVLSNGRQEYCPVGFVDDDREKRNQTIHGFKVLGNTRDIPRLVRNQRIDEVFIAVPRAPGCAKRRIMLTCNRAGVKCKVLPAVGQILNGNVTVRALRDFQIEDLLGRPPACLDTEAIGRYLRGKTVLITGAGGSIGSELCRQVAQFNPGRLVVFERSEFNLYHIQMNLLEHCPHLEVHPVIGDVLNQTRVEKTLERFRPEVVFHAAAYKHVPLMELNAEEALRNNAFGTWNIAHLATLSGVEKFVMISTDKAVRPTNIMGASKRMAEMICEGFNLNGPTKFTIVRFGNVLNSVGSVIPLFRRQIARGGPVTVTHPEVYRYFMTIPEAAQLILQAGAMGRGGEIFLLDMGRPVRIIDLARDMIRLSGFEPDKDIKITFTGLRPGEKLSEELLTAGEAIKSTLHEKIKVAAAEAVDWPQLLPRIEKLLEAMRVGTWPAMVPVLKEIVPEFQPENGGPKTPLQSIRNHSYEVSRTGEAPGALDASEGPRAAVPAPAAVKDAKPGAGAPGARPLPGFAG